MIVGRTVFVRCPQLVRQIRQMPPGQNWINPHPSNYKSSRLLGSPKIDELIGKYAECRLGFAEGGPILMCNLADNTIVAKYRCDVPFQIFESQHIRLRLATKCEKASHRAPDIVLQISRECGDSENPQTIEDYAWCDRRKWKKRDKHQNRSLNEFSRKVNESQSFCSVQKPVIIGVPGMEAISA